MSAISSGDVINLFKRVYGDLTNLLPEDYLLAKDIAFSQKQKVGEQYVEAVVLTYETGITMSSTTDAFELNPAIAGTIKQTTVVPYITVLPSVVPWGVISRSSGAGDKAFFEATKHIVKNNLRSHGKFQEVIRVYGQSPDLLGYVSYATATYRNVSFTNGSGTLNGVTFTNGINAASKYILLSPGSFAAGHWVGMEGVKVNQVDSSNNIVASGKLVGVVSAYGYLQTDFTPVAASSTSSHRLCYDGQEAKKEYYGVNSILTNTGSLFGISTSAYSLWSGNQYDCGLQKLTLNRFQAGVADAVNKGGLEGDLMVYCNPRTWATLVVTEAGLRHYDQSYNPKEAENGMESITFYTQAGKATFKPHRMVKEGEAYALHSPDWSRSGSSEVSFTVPGMNQEIIFPLENQAAYAFRSYSDQYLFCNAPARSILFKNINDESAT